MSSADRSPAAERSDPLKPLAGEISSPLPAAVPSGRVTLSDQPATEPTDEADLAQTKSPSLPPKLFPTERIGASRTLMPVPEMSDDDAVPANATDEDAAVKPLIPVPAAADQPPRVETAQLPFEPATTAPTLPAPATTFFLLHTETGESKSSTHP